MRTTINIDEHLLAEVKLLAARGHRTIGSVFEDALRRMLADPASTQTPGEFTLPAHGSGGLRSGVDLEDRDALADLFADEASHHPATG